MDIGSTLWPLILLKKSETLIDWCNAKGPIRENRIGYPRKWNQNWNPPTQWKVKCAFRLITGIDKLWIKRLKDVVLFGKNSFQMRENEKAGWKAIALLREIELEKLISVLTRCTWCADDCVRGCEVTYLYISGKITIPKQSECNVNSYNKDTVAFCKCEYVCFSILAYLTSDLESKSMKATATNWCLSASKCLGCHFDSIEMRCQWDFQSGDTCLIQIQSLHDMKAGALGGA